MPTLTYVSERRHSRYCLRAFRFDPARLSALAFGQLGASTSADCKKASQVETVQTPQRLRRTDRSNQVSRRTLLRLRRRRIDRGQADCAAAVMNLCCAQEDTPLTALDGNALDAIHAARVEQKRSEFAQS